MMRRYFSASLSALLVLLFVTAAFAGRDGAGDYTAPSNSFNPAVTGQPIDPTDWNAILDDIEDGLSESVYTADTSATDNCIVRADGTNGRKVQTSGVCIDDSDGVTGIAGIVYTNGAAIKTGTTASDTVLFQAYDNNTGPAYVTFGTLTAGNDPSFELDNTTLDTAIAKGTWTASGTWTIPAVTLGGTVSSNGQSFSGTIADIGTITTADINGGTIDGATIGGSSAGAGTFSSVTTTGNVELGNASDTSLARVSAGVVSIEGVTILTTATGQPLDSDLTAIAALTTTSFGRGLLELADAAALTAAANAFVGDSGAGGTKGMVPAPITGDASKFLRGDATWVTIPGGGDLLAANNLDDLDNVTTAVTNLGLDNTKIDGIEFVIDGGGATITTGTKGYLEVPYACTINRVTLLADQSGSIVVDVWKDTYANYPPVDADSITASAVPTISTATKSQDSTLTGWTTSVAAGDILGFNVDSVTTIQRVTVSLKCTKT